MDFDVSFEEIRLTMLLKQCIYDEHIKGRIIFFCSSDEPTVDVSTWKFNDRDLNILKESNYKFLLLQLLDCIAEYRSQFENLEYRGGIVYINDNSSKIVWMGRDEAIKSKKNQFKLDVLSEQWTSSKLVLALRTVFSVNQTHINANNESWLLIGNTFMSITDLACL